MDASNSIWIVMKQSTNLELSEPVLGVGMNVKELTHSQQQPQAPNAHKKVSTVRLTTRITMIWDPQRSLLYRLKDSIEVKYKTHTQQSTSSTQEKLRLVNLTENAGQHKECWMTHFQGSMLLLEYVPYTALTIV